MKLVFFLALLGCTLALQGPVEYEYQYTARIATGIQSALPQYAGSGIKAKVRITMQPDGSGDIQLQNVEVGEGSAELLDNGRQALPISYEQIHDKSIELPFKAHFRKQDGETVLEVPQNDLQWVSNVRRGVANFFRLSPIIDPGSVPHPLSDVPLVYGYSRVIDTFAGSCRVAYTITPSAPSDLKPSLRSDIQSKRVPKGPGGLQVKIDDEYHSLQASIDFSTCSDRVFLSQTGAGNLTNVTSSSYRDVATRSYVGEYILKGQPGKFRVERGDVESAVILQPFGIDSAKMVIMSNQTMELLSAKPAPRNVRSAPANLKALKTWNQQLQSPHKAPQGYAPRFMQYNSSSQGNQQPTPVFYERMASGFNLGADEQQQQLKGRVATIISKAVQRLRQQNQDSRESPDLYGGSEDGRIAQGLMDAQHLLRAIDVARLRELDQQLSRQQDQLPQEVFIDALAAAASGPAQKLLLEKIQARQLSDNRTASIFFNLANNIQSPEQLDSLVDFAASLQEEKNVTVSLLVKSNLALIIRRLCVSPQIKTYSHMMYAYGDKMCDRSKIVSKYLPKLQQKIESSSIVWVKILNVMAAADLGARESIPVLEKAARGDISQDIFVRYAAIHGLAAHNFDNSSRDQIFNILQPIAESRVEDYRIRQIAYDSLLTFKPNVTFIQRMIFSSHNEPSTQVQSYISWVVDSLARIEDPSYRPLSTAARNALALTRYMPASAYRPVDYIYSRYLHRDQVGSYGEEAWLSQYQSSFPRQIYSYISGKFGRFGIPLVETITFGNSQAAYAKLKSFAEKFTMKKGHQASSMEEERKQRLHERFHAMHGGIASRHYLTDSSNQEPDLYHFSRLWRTSEVFLPLTNELYQQTQGYMQDMLRNVGSGQEQDARFFKYLSPVESNVILPTPAGLFVKLELSTPTVLFGEVKMVSKTTPRLSDPSQLPTLQKINFRAEGIVKAVTKTNSYSYILSPWNNKTAVSGVDLEKTVSMPLKYEIEADLQMPAQSLWAQFTAKFNNSGNLIPVIKVRNLPFTAIGGLIPTLEDDSSQRGQGFSDLQPVKWIEQNEQWFREDWTFSKVNTGLNAKFSYVGEAQPPFSQNNVMSFLREPSRMLSLLASPSIKNFDMSISQPSEECDTKSIGVMVRFLQQKGSGESISPSSASKPVDASPEDSIQQREQKLQKFSGATDNYEVSAQVNFTGSAQPKVYEVAVMSALQESQGPSADFEYLDRKIQVSVLEKNQESHRPQKTCLVVGEQKSQLIPMPRQASLSAASAISSQVNADVFQGQSCAPSQQPILKSQTALKVSSARLAALRNITGSIPLSQGNSSEFYRLAVYDDLSMDVSWTDPAPLLKNWTLKAQDLVEGYLFPKIVKNRLQPNQPNKMSVRAQRFIGDNRANARVLLPQQTIDAETVNVISLFDPLVSFSPSELQRGQVNYRSGGRIVKAPSGDGCLVKPDQVQTFDGVSYRKPMTGCPIAAVRVSQGQDNIAVLTSQPSKSSSGPQEVQIISTKSALQIQVTGQSVRINERTMSKQSEVVKDASGNTIAMVRKVGDVVQVSITNKMEIAIKQDNLVMIKLDSRFKNVAQGLCGDYNSDAKDDLRGPHRCIYQPSNGDKFAASWVADESSCQEPEMKELFQAVKQYQQHCPTGRHQAVSGSQKCSNPQHVYPIGSRAGSICAGLSTVIHCQSGCHAESTKLQPIPSKCWSSATAPPRIRQNLSQGYMTSPPTEQAESERLFAQEIPSKCIPTSMSSRLRGGGCAQVQGHPLRPVADLYCVGEGVAHRCPQGCHPEHQHKISMQSKCWTQSTAPQDVKASLAQGYMENLPSEQAEFVKNVAQIEELSCVSLGEQQNRRQYQQVRGGSDSDCVIANAYPVRADSSLLCVAKQGSRVCQEGCSPEDTVPTQEQMKCWQRDQAPEQVRSAERRGYLTSPVSSAGQTDIQLSIQVPRRCSKQGN